MDDLTLINKALLRCGLPLAAAVADADWNASFILATVKEELLRCHAWSFARKIEPLAQSTQSTHGWLKTYELPSDCLKVVDIHATADVRAPKARYEIVAGRLACNIVPCYLRYVSDDVGVGSYPPDFANAVAYKVAERIAPLSGQSTQLAQVIAQDAEVALQKAMVADSQEGFDRVPLDRDILLRRGGISEDHRGR